MSGDLGCGLSGDSSAILNRSYKQPAILRQFHGDFAALFSAIHAKN
jgi:hypothetical protein